MKNKYDFDEIMKEFNELSLEEQDKLLNPPNLEAYNDYQFSNEFEKKMEKIINKSKKLERQRKRNYLSFDKFFKIAITTILIIFVYSFNTTSMIHGNLIDIINYCKEIINGDTYITVDKENNTNIKYQLLEPTYMPNGYREIDREETENIKIINYKKDKYHSIYYKYMNLENNQIMLNTENSKIKHIQIMKNDIALIYQQNQIKTFFKNNKCSCFISIDYKSSNETKNIEKELIKIIESILNQGGNL